MRRVELLGELFQEGTLDQMLGKPRFEEPPDVRKNVEQMTDVAEEVRALVERINEAERQTDTKRPGRTAQEPSEGSGDGDGEAPSDITQGHHIGMTQNAMNR